MSKLHSYMLPKPESVRIHRHFSNTVECNDIIKERVFEAARNFNPLTMYPFDDKIKLGKRGLPN